MKHPGFQLIILVLCFSNCTETNNKGVDNFSRVRELSGTPITALQAFCPSNLNVYDSLLIIVENCSDSIFQIYHAEDFSYLGAFGTRGEGPEEFTMPDAQSQWSIQGNTIQGYVLDLARFKSRKIDLLHSINSEIVLIEEYETNPNAGGLISGIQHLDSIVVLTSAEGTPSVLFHFKESNSIKWIENFPKLSKPYKAGKEGFIYNSVVRAKPDGTKIARAMDLFHRVDIYNTQGNLVNSIALDQEQEPDFSDPNNPIPESNQRYYVWLEVSDHYIYALNWNMTFGEFNNDIEKRTQLEVFDWDGNPKAMYLFDQRIVAIAVDENRKRIIGINDLKEQPYYVFDIQDDLDLLR